MYVYKYVAVQPRTYSDLLGSQNTTNTTNISNKMTRKVPFWGSIGLRPLSFVPTQKSYQHTFVQRSIFPGEEAFARSSLRQ